MLSRDADSCFWIGRYVERAEATARMVDVHYHAALENAFPFANADGTEELSPMQWHSILAISGSANEYAQRYGSENDRDVLHFFLFDAQNGNSLISAWTQARENARSIREQIASEMWETLNVSYWKLREWDVDRVMESGPHEYLQLVKDASHLFQGILNRTMLMGETRDWLDTGRFLERGGQTARLLDVKYHDLLPVYSMPRDEGRINSEGKPHPLGVGGPLDIHGWIAVLKSVSAFEMYRKTYRDIRPARVVEFLVLNPSFPASVLHCIRRVEGCLKRISGNLRSEPATEPERQAGRLLADLTYARADEIILNGLHEYLDSVQSRCARIGNAIARTYLT
jgi:uncharacterized alpha-E superfamily protein